MILAAGYGTRLWPLTVDRAKPAIPLLGRPLVGYVAEYLAGFGCREIIVNLHHQGDSVRAALGDGCRFGVSLSYVEEPEILGTSGAWDNARDFLEPDTFVAINGKIATDINLNEALETHRRANAIATLVLRRNEERERYSTVRVSDGRLLGFGPSPVPSVASDNEGENGSPLMFTGIQILEPRIFSYVPRGVFSHSTTDVYPKALESGETVAVHVGEGYWYELSTVRRYLETSLALLKMRGRDTEVGEGAEVCEGAEVRESVLWEKARVEPGGRVRRAVLGEGVVVKSGETIEDAAVVRAELVEGVERPPKGLEGEVRGTNFVAPLPR